MDNESGYEMSGAAHLGLEKRLSHRLHELYPALRQFQLVDSRIDQACLECV
jgi:hypothetical protein